MAASAAGICNVALLRVGERQTITTLADASQAAQVCNALYTPTRDALFETFDWAFLKGRATLQQVTGPVGATSDNLNGAQIDNQWGFTYPLPATCQRVRCITDGTRGLTSDVRVPYEVRWDTYGQASTFGRLLFTDYYGPNTFTGSSGTVGHLVDILYTRNDISEVQWSAAFADALSWRLAAELVLAHVVKPQLFPALDAKAKQALAVAWANDSQEMQEDQEPDSEFIRVRG